MSSPRGVLLLLTALALGCATGDGVAEGDEYDADTLVDLAVADDAGEGFVDAATFPFLDRGGVDGSRDAGYPADAGTPDAGVRDAGTPDVGVRDVGTPDVGVPCPAPARTCAGACVDTATSASHCGACGRACAAAQTCVAGVCTSPTASGPREGRACATGAECSGGDCYTDWPGGYCISPCLASGGVCGAGAVCIDDGVYVFCARSCTAGSQCRSGYGCARVSATGGACVPLGLL